MKKEVNGQTVIDVFEEWSSRAYAVDGDRVGLMVGTLHKPVSRVLVALDVTDKVIEEAISAGAELIIAHHPLIFRPLTEINTDHGQGPLIEKCIKNDIAVYAAHTNLDIAPGGVNDMMADALGLKDVEVLAPTQTEKMKKIVVFAPDSHASAIRKAIGDAGAGSLGDYSHCSFFVEGTGTFMPETDADPYIGESGRQEYVKEMRIETIVSESNLNRAKRAMLDAHPYEEPAYDVYSLDVKGRELGLGRIGFLQDEMTIEAFADYVKERFDVPAVRIAGDRNKKVRKVALLGGDGNKYWKQALLKKADIYLTGDIYYHTAHDAMLDGLNMIDPGHNVEKIMKAGTKRYMDELNDKRIEDVEWVASEVSTEPFSFI